MYFPPYNILPSFLYPQREEDRKLEEQLFGGKGVGVGERWKGDGE